MKERRKQFIIFPCRCLCLSLSLPRSCFSLHIYVCVCVCVRLSACRRHCFLSPPRLRFDLFFSFFSLRLKCPVVVHFFFLSSFFFFKQSLARVVDPIFFFFCEMTATLLHLYFFFFICPLFCTPSPSLSLSFSLTLFIFYSRNKKLTNQIAFPFWIRKSFFYYLFHH